MAERVWLNKVIELCNRGWRPRLKTGATKGAKGYEEEDGANAQTATEGNRDT
jgi:hypothetical protein